MKLNASRILMVCFAVLHISCGNAQEKNNKQQQKKDEKNMADKIVKPDEEWKKELTPEEYRVLRQKGTERAFTGDLLKNKEKGTYVCAGCGTPLFKSETKFDSGSGWPSFYDEIDGNVEEDRDTSLGMTRTEILCSKCGGHLGHVFDDGPKPTGLRYCVNSVSLDFKKEE